MPADTLSEVLKDDSPTATLSGLLFNAQPLAIAGGAISDPSPNLDEPLSAAGDEDIRPNRQKAAE